LKELISSNASEVKNEIAFKIFSKHIPEIGGRIVINELFQNCSIFNKLQISHTCSIDYFLLAFWCSSQLSKNFMDILNEIKENIDLNNVLVKVISLVDNFEWNRAKSIWLLVICHLNPNENLKFCTFNTEYESMVGFFIENQRYQFFCFKCSKEVGLNSTQIFLYKIVNDVFINAGFKDICEECLSVPNVRFLKKAYCLFIETFTEENVEMITIKVVPLIVTFNDYVFNFLCGTFLKNVHITSI
jgi:hypothetical protein